MITAAPLALQPSTPPALQPPRWQQLWRQAVRDPRELLALLGLDAQAAGISEDAAAQFAVRVPRSFVARMRPGDLTDPLLRQVLPLDAEMRVVPGFALDAVGDGAARTTTGVIQKYRGRALLIATGSCAVHCRYCFRRHFPYARKPPPAMAGARPWRRSPPIRTSTRYCSPAVTRCR